MGEVRPQAEPGCRWEGREVMARVMDLGCFLFLERHRRTDGAYFKVRMR